MNGRAWENEGRVPSRWLEGNSAGADAVRALSPAVMPKPMTAAETVHLGSQVERLARTGHLPGHGTGAPALLKLGAVSAVVGVALMGGAYYFASSRAEVPVGVAIPASAVAPPPQQVPVDEPRPLAAAEQPVEVVEVPAPRAVPTRGTGSPRGVARHARAGTAPLPAAAENDDALAIETRLLDEARELLVESPVRSLAVLADHRRRFPAGQLAAEREFMSIDALVRLRRLDDARRRADALKAAHPQSSYVARAARLLDGR